MHRRVFKIFNTGSRGLGRRSRIALTVCKLLFVFKCATVGACAIWHSFLVVVVFFSVAHVQ